MQYERMLYLLVLHTFPPLCGIDADFLILRCCLHGTRRTYVSYSAAGTSAARARSSYRCLRLCSSRQATRRCGKRRDDMRPMRAVCRKGGEVGMIYEVSFGQFLCIKARDEADFVCSCVLSLEKRWLSSALRRCPE